MGPNFKGYDENKWVNIKTCKVLRAVLSTLYEVKAKKLKC